MMKVARPSFSPHHMSPDPVDTAPTAEVYEVLSGSGARGHRGIEEPRKATWKTLPRHVRPLDVDDGHVGHCAARGAKNDAKVEIKLESPLWTRSSRSWRGAVGTTA